MKQMRQNAPNGWQQKNLGHLVAKTQLGGDYPSSLDIKGTPLVKMINIGRGVIVNCDKIERIDDSVAVAPRDYLQPGDLLLNTRNSLDLVGKVALWRNETLGATFNNNLMRLKFKPGVGLLNEYANLWFNSYNGVRQLRRIAIGTTSVAAIYWRDLASLKVCVPPQHEQRKIADILTTWDEALSQVDALIEAKERRKKALMQQLLTGRHRLKGCSEPWTRFRISELLEPRDRYVEFNDDHSYSLVSIRRRAGGVFFRETLHGGEIKTKVMKRVHTGDFLISRMQVVHGALGMVRPECDGMHASDSYEVLVAKDANLLHMPFFDWMSRMRSFWHLTYISSHGVHIEKMTFKLSDFMHEKITIPGNLEEQRHIATILDAAEQQLSLLHNQRNVIDQQRRGLMQRLLTGNLRVKP